MASVKYLRPEKAWPCIRLKAWRRRGHVLDLRPGEGVAYINTKDTARRGLY